MNEGFAVPEGDFEAAEKRSTEPNVTLVELR